MADVAMFSEPCDDGRVASPAMVDPAAELQPQTPENRVNNPSLQTHAALTNPSEVSNQTNPNEVCEVPGAASPKVVNQATNSAGSANDPHGEVSMGGLSARQYRL